MDRESLVRPTSDVVAAPKAHERAERIAVHGGQPLEAEPRTAMERSFQLDLSHVRVHADEPAGRAARGIAASAYTLGDHIVFAPGAYAPSTQRGRLLLAHEVAHVAQQRRGGGGGGHETDADAAARDAVAGRPASSHTAAAPGIQRKKPTRAELEQRAAELRDQLGTGQGVRSNEATQELNDELSSVLAAIDENKQAEIAKLKKKQTSGPYSPAYLDKVQQRIAALEGSMAAVSPVVNPAMPAIFSPGSKPLGIDFTGGVGTGGLGAEPLVHDAFYPNSTQLPAKFPGVDFIDGGQRTPITGTQGRTNVPFSQDSVQIEGGDLIQLKTLRNALPGFQKPGAILKALTGNRSGAEKLADFDTGGRSEKINNEYFRVESTGTPNRRILHVEFQQEPTPAQMAELADVETACKSLDIELVTNWPNKGALTLSPNVVGGIGLGVAVLGAYGRSVKKERDLNTKGYAAVGTAAYADAGILSQLGSFFRGDMVESLTQGPGPVNVPVWRDDLRRRVSGTSAGAKYNMLVQIPAEVMGTTNTHATYEKQGDGTWKLLDYDGPKEITPPDFNKCLDPDVSDSVVESMLTTTQGA